MKASRRKGMTLIEVLLAVAIAGTALVVLATGSARCVAVFRRSRDYQRAQWCLGLGELEHPLLATNDLSTWEQEDIEYAEGFFFSREVEEDDDEDDLFLVRTTVKWTRGPREFKEEVTRYVFAPEEKDK